MPKKFEDWISKIKDSLRKQFPKWTEKQISNYAYPIAVKRWEAKYGTNPLAK